MPPAPIQPTRRYPTLNSLALALLFALSGLTAPPVAAETSPLAGHWEGAIVLPGAELQILIDLESSEGTWSGKIAIPAQGLKDFPLADVEVQGDALRFRLPSIPGDPSFAGTLAEGRIRGTFRQGGAKLDFWLGREALPGPNRPQEPQPPFPYEQEEVTFQNGGVTLAGTLTLPEGNGPFPAAVLITGSGSQNRDEELMGHKPFLVLADHLTRAGIAVLRADDRGVGGSTGKVSESTTSDFADDALAGVALLAEHPRVDAGRIGLIGHSEGGLAAPLAATRSDRVAFIVLLSGPGVPAEEILEEQIALIARAGGASEEEIEAQLDAQARSMALLKSGRPNEEIEEELRALLREELERSPAAARPDNMDEAVDAQVKQVTTPWFRFFIGYDPAATLRQVEVPVLALNGELDLQVAPRQNLPALGKALAEAENLDVTLRQLPKLNHLFQHATTGSPMEYSQIEETFSPHALELISSWILDRFGEAR